MEGRMEKEKRQLFSGLRRELPDDIVLDAMEQVPRELFVPTETRYRAYQDIPCR